MKSIRKWIAFILAIPLVVIMAALIPYSIFLIWFSRDGLMLWDDIFGKLIIASFKMQDVVIPLHGRRRVNEPKVK